ncbi:WD repeat-containing protein on Y chromosome-like [Aphomia sociella]
MNNTTICFFFQRETIVKLISLEREDSFCYVSVSKGGRIGVYSGYLQLMNSYEKWDCECTLAAMARGENESHDVTLATPAALPHPTRAAPSVGVGRTNTADVQNLILASSDRSLTVYDATTLTHSPLFCITGLPNIPTCLAYTPSSAVGDGSELAFGTERGDLTRIRFFQPRVSLFYSKTPENINYYFWMELPTPPHTSYCSITTWRRVHARSVRRVTYTRNGDIIVSCSHDSSVSVRARHVPGKLDDYMFKVQRGVTCFHVVSTLHLIVTGSCDGVVRLWETTQSTPYANLMAPTAPAVLDVAVIASEEIVLAYCNNCTVHIWDMYEECLLQSIKLKFPFLGVLGKKVEFGAFCIHPGKLSKNI